MQDLKGKAALITGGTSGIGRATVLELARHGVHVVLTGRRREEGEKVAGEARALGVKAEFVQGDVTDESHVRAAVERAASLTGRLSLAFNNAGVELAGVPTAQATPEQYRKVFDTNVLGVLLAMKHEILAFGTNGGSIVNNASIAASIGMPGAGVYIGSKHAVLGLTRSAALDVARQGIRINTVSPGAIDTEMVTRFTNNRDSGMMQWMESMHPIGRIGKPEEIARAVAFLLSDASSFVTGHDLKVDGGFTVP